MRIRFQFRWMPFVAAMIAIIIGVSLGQWQLRRATEKETMEAKMVQRQSEQPILLSHTTIPKMEGLEYRRVTVRGEFVVDWPLYLDNRPHKGLAGLYMLMPLKMTGSDEHILVMRGWLPRNSTDRTQLPVIPTPATTVEIQGVIRTNAGRLMQMGNAEQMRAGAILQNLDVGVFSLSSKLKVQPFLIEQTSDLQDGLVRDWPKASSGIDKHLGYAFQWYALALMAFIFFVVTGIRRGPN